jgi:hypothetical protein
MAFSAESKMGELLDNAASKTVLAKYLPDLDKGGPMLKMARGMTLKAVAAFPQAKISAEQLKIIDTELKSL